MRFFGRGQGNRATGSYPSSSLAVQHVMHWLKRKQLVQKACWIHGLGMVAWIFQGFCLLLCLEPCYISAFNSVLAGKICYHAGEPVDISLTSPWLFKTVAVFHIKKMYFIDLYPMETSATSEGLPSVLVQVVQPPENLSSFVIPFFKFFSTFYFLIKKPFCFSKREECVGPANKKINENICP